MSLRTVMLADSPLVLWILDERSGVTVFTDSSGNGNHGNVSGATPGAVGPFGTFAPTFNGTSASCNRDSSVGALTGAFPTGDGACTMEAWEYPTSAGVAGCLVSYGLENGGSRVHRLFQGGNYTGAGSAFSDGVNAGNNVAWVTAAALNTWTHRVMTYAGGAGGALTFYLNAIVDVSTTATWSTTATPDRVRGGLRTDDARATQYYPGRLAAIAVYPTALSATRVRAHYDEGRRSSVVI